jgi:hypothetical protein
LPTGDWCGVGYSMTEECFVCARPALIIETAKGQRQTIAVCASPECADRWAAELIRRAPRP